MAGPNRGAWRDLPADYGPWETVASRFYRWRRQGGWDRALGALQADADARGELDWLLHFVDGSVVRAPSTLLGPGTGRMRPTWRSRPGGSRRS